MVFVHLLGELLLETDDFFLVFSSLGMGILFFRFFLLDSDSELHDLLLRLLLLVGDLLVALFEVAVVFVFGCQLRLCFVESLSVLCED